MKPRVTYRVERRSFLDHNWCHVILDTQTLAGTTRWLRHYRQKFPTDRYRLVRQTAEVVG